MGLLLGMFAAVGIGALHSLEPGHGKGILTAYLVSSKANTVDAVILGVVSAAGHTLSILLLAFLASTVKLKTFGSLVDWIELASGIVILIIGAKMLYLQIRPRVVVLAKVGQGTLETVGHHHHHGVFHHTHREATSPGNLFSIGFFTGLIPCPSAVAIFLASLGANQLSYGLAFVVAFSIGTALTMIIIGVSVVRLGHAFVNLEKYSVTHFLTTVSSVLILCLGTFVVFNAVEAFVSSV